VIALAKESTAAQTIARINAMTVAIGPKIAPMIGQNEWRSVSSVVVIALIFTTGTHPDQGLDDSYRNKG
jgi:hypothetical protein